MPLNGKFSGAAGMALPTLLRSLKRFHTPLDVRLKTIWRKIMEASAQPAPVSTKKLWAGIIISALPALFLLFDGVMKLVKPPIVVETTVKLGYPESVILSLGIVALACTVVYLIPRTSVLGAILLTRYLGGAVASHLRVGGPLFTHILFPVYFGALIWGGLYLRDERLSEHPQPGGQSASVSKKALWAGRIISAIPVLML